MSKCNFIINDIIKVIIIILNSVNFHANHAMKAPNIVQPVNLDFIYKIINAIL
jgi:UDP-N-acetyl-D-mannosaminuronic acid transferase (WecB/TagA/CpsF family)